MLIAMFFSYKSTKEITVSDRSGKADQFPAVRHMIRLIRPEAEIFFSLCSGKNILERFFLPHQIISDHLPDTTVF